MILNAIQFQIYLLKICFTISFLSFLVFSGEVTNVKQGDNSNFYKDCDIVYQESDSEKRLIELLNIKKLLFYFFVKICYNMCINNKTTHSCSQ